MVANPSPDGRQEVATRPPVLEAVEVTTRHGDDFLALDAVSLKVRPGEIYCLLGAAGAGKTLLLHTFMGFSRPSAGNVFVCGIDAAQNAARVRQRLTYVAHGASLYRSLTARQNVEFFTRVDGRRVPFGRRDYYNAMRTIGVPERYFEKRVADLGPDSLLSLWLAVGLLKNTPVLLLDEPTVGLDLYASAGVQQTLMDFRASGKALLIATSDVLFAGAIADRVGIIKDGRKRIELSRIELMGRALPDLYLEYMGRPFNVGKSSVRG